MNSNFYKNKKVLITGGLGFIGSNIAIECVKNGADVTIVDSMIPEYGGNLFNVDSIKNKIKINFSDIRDEHSINYLVRNKNIIFHCAGQVNHILSLNNPFPDIDMNIKGTAILLEACRKYNPDAVVVRTGTRGQYGNATKLPVDESAATNPRGIYEVSHLAAEKIMQIYNDVHKIKSVLLRLTNVYGPRGQMFTHQYSVANWFIRLALDDQTIKVFGDGSIKRDFLFIDDCVEAIMKTAANENCYGEVINVGHDQPVDFKVFVETLIKVAGQGKWEFAPFSEERKAQEPGDFYSCIEKIKKLTNWIPSNNLEQGLEKTVEFYKKYRENYWKKIK